MKAETLAALQDARSNRRALALATRLSDGAETLIYPDRVQGALSDDPALVAAAHRALGIGRSETVEIGGERIFLNVYVPPPRLIVVGAVHIAQALAPMATMLDFDVTVVDPRGAWATANRFPGVKVVQEWADEAFDKMGLDTLKVLEAAGHGYLLADHTDHYKGTTKGPGGDLMDAGWGQKVVDLVEEWDADCVVAEINQGGDMVRSIVHLINPNISVEEVRAKHGKHLRAEPVAQLYWRGNVHHVGSFQELEDQMCEVYDPHHPTITWDNMDSVVYGFRYLLLGGDRKALRGLDPNLHKVARPKGPGKPTALMQ